ncbi:MAG: hypothetical protein M3Y56_09620 [Armatimonadota bacterium]|nr:hypothetical protein [Armatimonadota bacterium]
MSIVTRLHPAPGFSLPPRIQNLPAGITYHFRQLSRRPLVVRVTRALQPRSCNFIVTQLHGGELVCTCPAFASRLECEHTAALSRHIQEEIDFHERHADRRASEVHAAITGLRAATAEVRGDW